MQSLRVKRVECVFIQDLFRIHWLRFIGLTIWGIPEMDRMDVVLPGDLIVEILSWLPVDALLRFRCVCKSWKSLIFDPSFKDLAETPQSYSTTHSMTSITPSSPFSSSKLNITELRLHCLGDNCLEFMLEFYWLCSKFGFPFVFELLC